MPVRATILATDNPFAKAFATLVNFSASLPTGLLSCFLYRLASSIPAEFSPRMFWRSYWLKEENKSLINLSAGVRESMP